MTAPTLTGLDAPTFAENLVNATPQVIDSDVTFTDPDNDFTGGTLTVSGLLAEDTVSILTGAVIYRVGADVFYDADGAGGAAGVIIGSAAGGAGATFTVTFNASATSAIVELVVESLTYANSSDTPAAATNCGMMSRPKLSVPSASKRTLATWPMLAKSVCLIIPVSSNSFVSGLRAAMITPSVDSKPSTESLTRWK